MRPSGKTKKVEWTLSIIKLLCLCNRQETSTSTEEQKKNLGSIPLANLPSYQTDAVNCNAKKDEFAQFKKQTYFNAILCFMFRMY